MISVIITAYEDPFSTKECIRRILSQENFHENYEIIAACPDEATKKIIFDYKKKHPKKIIYVRQDDPSKNNLINKILKIAKGDILVWTDGNKFLKEDALSKILKPFEEPEVGCAGGRPFPMNTPDNMLGFWAHTLTGAVHKLREKRFKGNQFVEQSANLLAIRRGIIEEIPGDVAEDAIIPFLIIQKGYKNVYVGDALVYVMYPRNVQDWLKQKIKSIKCHALLEKYLGSAGLKQESFFNEARYGLFFASSFRNIKEFCWICLLYFARLYIWLRAYYEIKIKKSAYSAQWSRAESTKPLDYKNETKK